MADGDLTVHQSIVEIINEMGGVGKGDYNKEQKYWFRGIDAVLRELHPLFAKYGIFFAPHVMERVFEDGPTAKSGAKSHRAMLMVEYTIYGPAGDSISVCTWGEGLDYADKAHNKAMTAAFKYALFQVFAICDPAEDADREGPTGTDAEQTPLDYLIELLQSWPMANGVKRDVIHAAIGRVVTNVSDLTADEIVTATLAIEQAMADEGQLKGEKE